MMAQVKSQRERERNERITERERLSGVEPGLNKGLQ